MKLLVDEFANISADLFLLISKYISTKELIELVKDTFNINIIRYTFINILNLYK